MAHLAPLADLHAAVDLPLAERDEITAQVHADIQAVVERITAAEQARFDAMREELPAMRDELKQLAAAMGADAVPDIGSESDLKLVPQHRNLTTAVEGARALRAQRLEQRTDKEAKIAVIRAELDGDGGHEAGEETPAPKKEPDVDAPGGLTLALLGRLQARLDGVNDERSTRVAAVEAVHKKIEALRAIGIVLTASEQEAGKGEVPRSIDRAALAAAEQDLAALDAERARRTQVLTECLEYITELRATLELSEAECPNLPDPAVAGLSEEVLLAYHYEIERLESLRAAALGPLLTAARARLRPLWKDLHMSDEETRTVCPAAWPEEVGADVEPDVLEDELQAVEAEEKRLKLRLEEASKIIGLTVKREALLTQRTELRASQTDPSKQHKPGSAQWLREDKMRREVENNLPKINAKLKELAKEWAGAHEGEEITFEGVAIVSLVVEQEEADRCASAMAPLTSPNYLVKPVKPVRPVACRVYLAGSSRKERRRSAIGRSRAQSSQKSRPPCHRPAHRGHPRKRPLLPPRACPPHRSRSRRRQRPPRPLPPRRRPHRPHLRLPHWIHRARRRSGCLARIRCTRCPRSGSCRRSTLRARQTVRRTQRHSSHPRRRLRGACSRLMRPLKTLPRRKYCEELHAPACGANSRALSTFGMFSLLDGLRLGRCGCDMRAEP